VRDRSLQAVLNRHRGRTYARHAEDAPAVAVESVAVRYGDDVALENVSFRVEVGERLAVVGPNGAGKSTLLRVLVGLQDPTGGAVHVHGHGPSRHVCISYTPQKSTIDWRFPVTVSDVVRMGRIARRGPARRMTRQGRSLVQQALRAVALEPLAHRQISELSGGQQQRMFIARALAQEAEILLMDEPFTGLDVNAREDVLQQIVRLHERDVTCLVALHDLAIASTSFDKVLLLRRQQIGFGAPSEVFSEARLRRAYGECLRLAEADGGLVFLHDTACTGGSNGHP